jgi:serine/threonine protein phosphatase 1
MRTIVIGDIHGSYLALKTLLQEINPTKDDTIITIGDVIDRGPDTKKVLDTLLDLRDKCNYIQIMGNHELMLLRAFGGKDDLKSWLNLGGRATLSSYGHTRLARSFSIDEVKQIIPWSHLAFIKDFKTYHETDEYVFVHAGYDWDAPLNMQTEKATFWGHITPERYPRPHISGKTFWVGHTPQKGKGILDLGHLVCVDSVSWLTAMDVDTRQVWQATRHATQNDAKRTWQSPGIKKS